MNPTARHTGRAPGLRPRLLLHTAVVFAGLQWAAPTTAMEAAGWRTSTSSMISVQEAGRVVGHVLNGRTGQPLAGAHVTVEGTNIGSLTDSGGRYTLAGVPLGEVTVHASYIGYSARTQTVAVAGSGAVVVDFTLAEEALALDGILVTGTAGQARRREVGNSIAQLDVARFDEPAASVDQLLQGRSPSVTVNPGSSSFGAGAAIRLRGNVSLSMSNQPLIFVDGVRQAAESYPLNASNANFPHYGPSSQMSPLNDLNPSDIERIEIVKGAAAATLYGSEASAGVIQIFTKKGSQGNARWTLTSDHGIDWVRPFGSEQRPFINLDPWLQNAYSTRNSLAVSGGVAEVRYFLSGGYDVGDGVLPNDHENRLALRANVDLTARPDLTLQFNTAFTQHDLEITHTGNSGMALPFNAFRQPNNSFGSDDPAVLSQLLDAEIHQANTRFTAGFTATWTPVERVTQRLTVGLDRVNTHGTQLRPLGFALEPLGALSDIRWQSEALTLDYVGSVDVLRGSALASTLSWGAQSVSTEESTVDTYGTGFPGPGLQTLSSVAERTVYGGGSRIISAGLFGQGLVAWQDRIFLTAGARVDGTSTFGQDLGLQVYPKASLSWVISEEGFWPITGGSVKLRAAYGWAGRAPGAFDAVRTWMAGSFGGESSFLPENVGNPNLGAEKTREVEVGFDGVWFDSRLTAELTYYDQSTTDALLNVSQVPSMGFTGSQLENVGSLTNRGFELGLTGTVVRSDALAVTLGANLSESRSEVLDAGGTTSANIQVGQPAPVVRGTRVLNARAYADPVLERDHYFGPAAPTRIVGLNAAVEFWDGFRLSARGEYQGGHYISDGASNAMIDRGNGAPGCDAAYQHVPFGAYPAGDLSQVTALERVRCYRGNITQGVWIYPADFFKVREITLLAPITPFVPGADNATLTLSLQNALRWTNEDFWAFDPEMISSRSTTSALAGGITEHAPAPARFVASFRISF
jgi:TonB-dependent starch-binding outer membrane protein SusC